jgi:hypothetical protein
VGFNVAAVAEELLANVTPVLFAGHLKHWGDGT